MTSFFGQGQCKYSPSEVELETKTEEIPKGQKVIKSKRHIEFYDLFLFECGSRSASDGLEECR